MELIVFLLLIAVVYLLVKVTGQSTKLRELEMRVSLLAAPHPPEGRSVQAPAPPSAPDVPPPVPQAAPPSRPAGMETPEAPKAMVTPAPAPPLPPPKRQRTSQEWEWLIGGKLLNRIAAVALVLGVSFFLKYAIDRNWISEWLQIGIGLAAGSALLFGASRMQRKGFQVFSQGLVGAGIAILYISVYASFNYYSLVSQPVAFLMMGAVTVVTFTQAFRYDSLAVSLLGWAGGFATPFLLSRGEANAVGLFGYIALLDAGLLAVIATRKRWWVLLPLAFVATYGILALWLDTKTGHEDDITGAIAVTAFWLLFHAIDLLRGTQERSGAWVLERILAVLNGLFFFFTFYYLLDDHLHDWMGFLTLMASGIYAGSVVIFTHSASARRDPVSWYSMAALVLLICATEIQFEGFHATYCFALEVALLALIARWRSGKLLWGAATVLLVWATLALLFQEHAWTMLSIAGTLPILNERTLAFAMLIGAAVAGLFLAPGIERPWALLARGVLHATWAGLLGVLLPVEISDALRSAARTAEELMARHLRYLIGPSIGLAWAVYGAILAFLSRGRKIIVLQLFAAFLGILGALVTTSWSGAGFTPPEWFTAIFNLRFVASVLTIAALVWLARTFMEGNGVLRNLVHVFAVAWIVTGFATLTAEIVNLYGQFIRHADVEGALPFARLMVLAAAWAVFGAFVFFTGTRKGRTVPLIGGLILIAAGWATALFRGIAFEPVVDFTPILNMRLAAILVTMGAIVVMRILASRQENAPSWLKPAAPVLRIMTALLLLTLVTGEIRDYFEKAIALRDPSVADRELENIKQLMLSGAWLAFSISLMGYGIIGRERILRMLSIVLFGVAILKIFIYDLSFLETLYRIFSFIGLGLILLVVSYLYQRFKDVIMLVEKDANEGSTEG
jgi:uncharacterized membrane protein